MWHTRVALARPITTWMAFAALAIIGLISARLLPLEELPDMTFPGLMVTVPYPGTTPEEVERLITRPIEEALATLHGIQEIRSTSAADQAEVQVAMTWGGDIEARAFAEAHDQFVAAGASVVGMSNDDMPTLQRFSTEECRSKFG